MVNKKILGETVIGFSEGREKTPGNPSYFQLWSWAKHGLLARKLAKRVTLEYCQQAGRYVTSLEAVERFYRKLNGG